MRVGKYRLSLGQLSLLAVLPLVYLLAQLTIGELRGPYWFVSNQDPDYAYFFNSLSIANLKVPGIYHHPGTTVQILGALVLRLSYGVQRLFNPGSPDFLESVFTHSEQYLSVLNVTLIGLTVLSMMAIGLVSMGLGGNLILSILLQSTPLLMLGMIVLEPSRFAPEHLMLVVSQGLVLWLVLYLFTPQAATSRRLALALGGIAGAGLVTKTTFLPLVLFFLLISGWRRKGLAAIATLGTFATLTIPIYPQFLKLWDWSLGLATRTGVHGNGEVGLVDFSTLGRNVSQLVWRDHPLIFVLVWLLSLGYIGLLIIFWRTRLLSDPPTSPVPLRKLLWVNGVTLLVIWVQMLITFRANAIPRYLTPSIGLIGFLLVVQIQIWMVAIARWPIPLPGQWGRDGSLQRRGLPAVVLAVVMLISVQQAYAVEQLWSSSLTVRRAELSAIDQIRAAPQYAQCYVVPAIRSSDRHAALFYGSNWWDQGNLSATLKRLYPDDVFYNIRAVRRNPFEAYDQEKISFNQLLNQGQGCVLLYSTPLSDRNARFRPPGTRLEPLFVGKSEALYRVWPRETPAAPVG